MSILEEAIKFFPSNQIPKGELVGYDLQRNANMAIGLASLDVTPCFVLAFGIPGTGKSVFPFDLARRMDDVFKIGVSMMHVSCDKVLSSGAPIQTIMNALQRSLTHAHRNLPAFVVFDEIDSLSAPIGEADEYAAALTRWLRNYGDSLYKETFTIGITNYPFKMDFSVWRRIRSISFFDLTPNEVHAGIIKHHFGRSIISCRKVCDVIHTELEKTDFVPLGADVEKACIQLEELHTSVRQLSDKRLGKDLANLITGSPRHFIEAYRQKYQDHIVRAKSQMSWWEKELKRRTKSFLRRNKPTPAV
jgi:SpoVK/Ycf46/Vps4 family AAA+-type ATPase